MRRKSILTAGLILVIISFSIVTAINWPQKIRVTKPLSLNGDRLYVTAIIGDEWISYKLDEDGEATVGKGIFGIKKKLVAVHDENYCYWEGIPDPEQTIVIKINPASRRSISENLKKTFRLNWRNEQNKQALSNSLSRPDFGND